MKCKLETFNQSTSSKVIKPQKHRLWFQDSNSTSRAFLFEFPLNETAFPKKRKNPEKNKLNQTVKASTLKTGFI